MNQATTICDLQQGKHKAYEKLFKDFYTPLCRYAYGILRDANEAEDMVQKMFCKLYDQREKIEIHTSIQSYLYRIVHNDCMNRIKQRNLHSEHNELFAYEKETQSNSVEHSVLSNACSCTKNNNVSPATHYSFNPIIFC